MKRWFWSMWKYTLASSKALLPRSAVHAPLVVVLGAVLGASMFLMLTYGPLKV